MKRIIILVVIMAVTNGMFAQNNFTPRVVTVSRLNVFPQAVFEPNKDETRVFVRSNNFLYGGQPLVFIDGLEVSDGLSSLRPDDIKSITILKDAKSIEIYGTRGINGVILIVTKSGNNEMEINKAECQSVESNVEDTVIVEVKSQFVDDVNANEYVSDNIECVFNIEIEVGIGDEEMENSFPDLKIYPNPFSRTLHVEGAVGATLHVISEDGIIIHTQNLINDVEIIPLGHLRSGVYFFRVNDGKHTKTLKGVKN